MVDIKTAETGRGAAWLIEGFEYFRRSAGPWIGVLIIMLVITIASGIIPFAGLVIQLLTPVFIGGLILGCRQIGEGGELKINHLFAGFNQYTGNLVLLGVIYSIGVVFIIILMVLALFIIVGGLEFISSIMEGNTAGLAEHLLSLLLVLLIGLLFYLPLLMAFWFAPALIVLDDQGPMESMKISFMGCLKNIIPFLIYGVVGLVLSILASIPFGLGWFILMPMIIASIYLAYLDIFQTTKPVTVAQD